MTSSSLRGVAGEDGDGGGSSLPIPPLTVRDTPLPGLRVVTPVRHGDARGDFAETYHAARYAAAGLDAPFAQDNVSRSARGTLRGLHAQAPPHAQAKLVTVLAGEIVDVAVDLRIGSPTFGRWHAETLSDADGRQLYVPEGLAHGFCVTSETAVVLYKVSGRDSPGHEISVAWDDPDLAIAWPTTTPVLSDKDRAAPRLRDLASPFTFQQPGP